MIKKVKASHILVKTEEEAEEILHLVADGKDFKEVAREKSQCPSKEKGGSLGWFKKGQMVPEFEQACFLGSKGELIGPIKTQFGWHVIKIEDTK